MNPILHKNLFLIKEHIGMFKASNNYDILDPVSQQKIMLCKEEGLGFLTKLIRFTDYKRMTPFNVTIQTTSGEPILTVKRGISIFASTVEVLDENQKLVGIFKQKFFSIGGNFNVLDAQENVVCTLKGKWTSWDFKFSKDNIEYAQVSKKWAGIGKELFTSADNYMLTIHENVAQDDNIRLLILGAVICIDMVLKE